MNYKEFDMNSLPDLIKAGLVVNFNNANNEESFDLIGLVSLIAIEYNNTMNNLREDIETLRKSHEQQALYIIKLESNIKEVIK